MSMYGSVSSASSSSSFSITGVVAEVACILACVTLAAKEIGLVVDETKGEGLLDAADRATWVLLAGGRGGRC